MSDSSPSAPFQLQLRGRDRFIGVCHEDLAICESCLRSIARFLAAEMEWDVRAALDRAAGAYAAELDISAEQGLELRRLTILECWLMRPDYTGFVRRTTADDLIVADELVIEVAA